MILEIVDWEPSEKSTPTKTEIPLKARESEPGIYPAMYKRAPRLYQEIAIARADESYPKLMNKLSKIKVLIIDDFCIAPMSDQERRDLLEVLEDRQSIYSTIIATQVPIENWI